MNPLTIPLLLVALATHQVDRVTAVEADRRIQQTQYGAAIEARAQHREVERVQPASHLEPELEDAHRRFNTPRRR